MTARRTTLDLSALGAAALIAALGAGCAKTDDDYKRDITQGMHDTLLSGIDGLLQASKDVRASAPRPTGRGWDATQDAAAITATKAAWVRARRSYELIEGALAPIFPDIDFGIDARYDDYLAAAGASGDTYLFDDQGVTGLHGVERVLYAHEVPPEVITFESQLPGYRAPAWPATEQEAADFRDSLCARMVADAQALHDQWTPANIDLGGAFDGLVALMNEQKEKVNKASTSEEESRYSQRTMADIRDNLEGTRQAYELFEPWLESKPGASEAESGRAVNEAIRSGFEELDVLYGRVNGDAIPRPPSTWSSENPGSNSPADLASPFGVLYTGVHGAVDPATQGSVVERMNRAAALLGFEGFEE
ncbi:MAG TPA: imelysin family protein [Myxococcaceae bacterium]|jgi:iron uptake system component EfeO